jgi:hypothetical protein
MIDKRPAAIARCRSVGDIVAAVELGREQGLELSGSRAVQPGVTSTARHRRTGLRSPAGWSRAPASGG